MPGSQKRGYFEPMSQENLDLTRAADEAWNAGNWDALRELWDPYVVVRTTEEWPERGILGREAALRWAKELRDTWDSAAVETISRDDAGDRVVVRQILRGTGHGPASKIETTTIATVRDGKIILLEYFWNHTEALEALGLSQGITEHDYVEIVRATIDAYSSGDREAYLEFFTEDVEVHPDVSRFPQARPFHGREQFRRFLADIDEGWEGGATAVIREIFPVGDRIVARADWGGKGRTSGIELLSSLTSVYSFRGTQIVKVEYFFDHAEALKAVGSPADAWASS